MGGAYVGICGMKLPKVVDGFTDSVKIPDKLTDKFKMIWVKSPSFGKFTQ